MIWFREEVPYKCGERENKEIWIIILAPLVHKLPDLQKVVDPGNLVPRKYSGCKKIFSPDPALLSKIKSFAANPALLNHEGKVVA